MKILDIPQSGKEGLSVSLQGRYGQVRRALVIPTNPRTSAQMGVRDIFSRVAKGWRALTQVQRNAWIAAAAQQKSKSRLGQSGPLTGSQLYVKVNATLSQFGQATVNTPPSIPAFPALAPQNLVITNTGGVIALRLTCPTDPGEATIIRASAPQSAGREVCKDVRVLGACPAPMAGVSDITGLYTARFGVPAVGSKVFVVANQFVDGYEDLGTEFVAVVPSVA